MTSFPVQYWNIGIGPISCHAWNKDRSCLALSPSNSEIHVFHWEDGQWRSKYLLNEHTLTVTGIDWAPKTNRIVSCSQDQSAYVWTFSGTKWKPELVLVRICRAATCVRWSPFENKFAVGSGEKLVSICYYGKDNDWWISKQIKKGLQSTITCIDWHPDNILLAVCACDFKTRVFSAYIEEIDEKPTPNPWGTKMPFGALLCDVKCIGWVHHVAFSPSGCRLAYVDHGSSVYLIDTIRSTEEHIILRTNCLPFTSINWVTENSLVAVGHDSTPILFTYMNDALKLVIKLDVPSEQKTTIVNTAMQKFRNIDRNAAAETINVKLKTLHQNAIMQVLPHTGQKQNIQKFSTCGIDGLVAIWDIKGSIEYCRVNISVRNYLFININ